MELVKKHVETPLETKAKILADLWINYGQDPDFEDFFAYHDLGLPLAYAFDNGILIANEKTIGFIDETFEALLSGLELADSGFEDLQEVLTKEED